MFAALHLAGSPLAASALEVGPSLISFTDHPRTANGVIELMWALTLAGATRDDVLSCLEDDAGALQRNLIRVKTGAGVWRSHPERGQHPGGRLGAAAGDPGRRPRRRWGVVIGTTCCV